MRLIINTRPKHTSMALQQALQQRGMASVNLPGLRVAGPPQPLLTSRVLRAARSADVWVFTSINAIEHTFELLAEQTMPAAGWPAMAVLGKGSRACLDRHLQRCSLADVVILTPPAGAGHDSEALLQHPMLSTCSGRQVLILNAPCGRDTLLTTLRQRGAQVRELAVYRRLPAALDASVLRRIANWPDGLLTLWTSSASVQFLQQQFKQAAATQKAAGALWQRLLAGHHLVLSVRQQQLLQQLDAVTICLARAPDTDSLAEQLQHLGKC